MAPRKTPTFMQYALASEWMFKGWFIVFPICFTLSVLYVNLDELAAVHSCLNTAICVSWIAFFLALGFFVSIVPGVFVFSALNAYCEDRNGGPFAVGDKVYILAKPYRGVVSNIYSSWQGCSFRVDLGPEAKAKFRDIFIPAEVIKMVRRRRRRGQSTKKTEEQAAAATLDEVHRFRVSLHQSDAASHY